MIAEKTRLGTTFSTWDLDNCWREIENTIYLTKTDNGFIIKIEYPPGLNGEGKGYEKSISNHFGFTVCACSRIL